MTSLLTKPFSHKRDKTVNKFKKKIPFTDKLNTTCETSEQKILEELDRKITLMDFKLSKTIKDVFIMLSKDKDSTEDEKIKAIANIITKKKFSKESREHMFNILIKYLQNYPDKVDLLSEEGWMTVLKLYDSKYITSKKKLKLNKVLSRYIRQVNSEKIRLRYLFYDYTITKNKETLREIEKTIKKMIKSKTFSTDELLFVLTKLNKKPFRNNKSNKQIRKIKKHVNRYILEKLKEKDYDFVLRIMEDHILKKNVLKIIDEKTILKLIILLREKSNFENEHDKWLRRFIILLSSKEVSQSSKIYNKLKKLKIFEEVSYKNKEVYQYLMIVFKRKNSK